MDKPVVLYGVEELRDGTEEWARVYPRLEDALRAAEGIMSRAPAGSRHNHELRIFELGREIPVEWEVVRTPGPPVETVRVKTKSGRSPS